MLANVQSPSVRAAASDVPHLDLSDAEFHAGLDAGFDAALEDDGKLDDLDGDLDDDDDDFDDDDLDDDDDEDDDDLDDDLIDLDDEYDGKDEEDRPHPGPGRNDD